MTESFIPCQAQAEGMHNDEELYDHRSLPRSKKPESDSVGKAATPFPEEKVVMSIYGGPAPHESRRKLKLTDRVINSMSVVVPKFLRWSKSSITFDRMDHPYSIPKPGRFLLIVDPMVGTTRLTKALMDGAAASTSCTSIPLMDWGLPRTSSRVAHTHFTKWSQVSSPSTSDESPCQSPWGTQATTAPKCFHSK
jgi:hypothetical protein